MRCKCYDVNSERFIEEVCLDIPPSCEQWAETMGAGGTETGRILSNVRKDGCVDPEVANEFFNRLGSRAPFGDQYEAKTAAFNVVQGDQNRFTCKGKAVPADRFRGLFRLEDVESLRYRVPEALDRAGVTDSEVVADLAEEDLLTLTNEYDGEVSLGNRLGVVWCADAAGSLAGDMSTLVDRLGIAGLKNADRCVLCRYDRSRTGRALHVPRMLDAIDRPEFEVVKDCEADNGMTRPLRRPAAEGLPEAVHRRCTVVPELWELRELQ